VSKDNGAVKEPDQGTGLADKLEALARERDNLRQEVSELRKALEDIQGKHDQEIKNLQVKLETAEESRDEADQRHSDLRVRVKEITATLGERLKSNTVWTIDAPTLLFLCAY
jgi:predicted nuclease with TOPRIM domain